MLLFVSIAVVSILLVTPGTQDSARQGIFQTISFATIQALSGKFLRGRQPRRPSCCLRFRWRCRINCGWHQAGKSSDDLPSGNARG